MNSIRMSLLTIFVLLLTAGCATAPAIVVNAPASQEPVQAVPSHAFPQTALPNPIEGIPPGPTPQGTPDMSTPMNPDKFTSLVKRDLAERLKIGVDQISAVKAVEMTWPNAALGCPQPGKVYAQGLVAGFKIWLEANDAQYIYHTDMNGQFVLCPEQNPDESVSGSTPGPEIGVPIK